MKVVRLGGISTVGADVKSLANLRQINNLSNHAMDKLDKLIAVVMEDSDIEHAEYMLSFADNAELITYVEALMDIPKIIVHDPLRLRLNEQLRIIGYRNRLEHL